MGLNESTHILGDWKEGFFPPESLRDKDEEMKTSNNDISMILQVWSNLSSSLPLQVKLPIGLGGSPLDFSVCFATFWVLGCINAAVQSLLVNYGGFPKDKSQQLVAASAVGILHSTLVVSGCCLLFVRRRYLPCEKMSEAPLWWQDASHALMQFCTGYMMYDFCAMIINGDVDPSDYAFLAHHAIVVVMITSARMVGAGHVAVMMLIVLGEVTNPFQNGYYMTSTALKLDCCKELGWLRTADYVTTFLFCVSYIFVRTFFGWAMFGHMTYSLFVHGKKNGIPIGLSIFWSVLKWAIAVVSIAWVQDCIRILQENYFTTGDASKDSSPDL